MGKFDIVVSAEHLREWSVEDGQRVRRVAGLTEVRQQDAKTTFVTLLLEVPNPEVQRLLISLREPTRQHLMPTYLSVLSVAAYEDNMAIVENARLRQLLAEVLDTGCRLARDLFDVLEHPYNANQYIAGEARSIYNQLEATQLNVDASLSKFNVYEQIRAMKTAVAERKVDVAARLLVRLPED